MSYAVRKDLCCPGCGKREVILNYHPALQGIFIKGPRLTGWLRCESCDYDSSTFRFAEISEIIDEPVVQEWKPSRDKLQLLVDGLTELPAYEYDGDHSMEMKLSDDGEYLLWGDLYDLIDKVQK